MLKKLAVSIFMMAMVVAPACGREAPVPPGNDGGPIGIVQNDNGSKAVQFKFEPEKMTVKEREQHKTWAREAIVLLASYGTNSFPKESQGKYLHDGFGGYLFFVGAPSYEVFVIDVDPRKEIRRIKAIDKEYQKLLSEFRNKFEFYHEKKYTD